MTVRELIKELIDYNLDAEIVVATDKTYINELGQECNGRMFEIKNINTFGSCVEILFDDWRDEERTKAESEKLRCNSCRNNTDELSGECYECVKGIEDWYEPLDERVKPLNQESTSVVEELEKIKEEMKKVSYQMININDEFYDLGFRIVDLEDINEVIENRIYELKGDNNTDCRNCDKWKTCENGEKGHANGTSIGYSIGECKDYAELKGEQK